VDAKLPTYAHFGDAGMDFYALETVVFAPGKREKVSTGIAVEIPEGCVGFIWDKSGVSFKMGLKVLGGVIDSTFRGEVVMCLFNTSDKEVTIEKGHKVAQMVVQKYEHCDILEVSELSETLRGEGREGSTGHK
jgi:dUTP pyrophosphatase